MWLGCELFPTSGVTGGHGERAGVRDGIHALLCQIPRGPRGQAGGRASLLHGHAQQEAASERGAARRRRHPRYRHARRPQHQPRPRQGAYITSEGAYRHGLGLKHGPIVVEEAGMLNRGLLERHLDLLGCEALVIKRKNDNLCIYLFISGGSSYRF